MIKKTVTYTDYNGNERTEDHYFNLSNAEITEMEFTTIGGLSEMINKIIATDNTPEIYKLFKNIVLKAYGEKSLDGKRFMKMDEKGVPLYIAFSETEAYSVLMMELVSDAKKAADFFNGVIPTIKTAKSIPVTN